MGLLTDVTVLPTALTVIQSDMIFIQNICNTPLTKKLSYQTKMLAIGQEGITDLFEEEKGPTRHRPMAHPVVF